MNFTPLKKIPDVSFWQDNNSTKAKIDFVKMRSKVEGVIIRAGQNTWVDEDFTYNWTAAKQAGLKRGAYWFFDPRNEPIAQAKLFTDLFKNDPPEYGLWDDFEHTWAGTYNSEAYSKKFHSEVDRLYNGVVGVYTANWWWKYTDDAYWSQYPLWVAQYTPNPADVILPSSWRNKGKNAVLWQYTDKEDGLAHGVESYGLDMNYTSQAFYDLFGDSTPQPGDNMYYLELDPINNSSAMSIRADHPDSHIQGAKIGSIPPGGLGKATPGESYTYAADKYVDGILRAKAGDIWHKAFEPLVGWVAEIHLGVRYMNVREINPPPPPPPPSDKKITSIEINLAPGSTVKRNYSDGTSETETA